MSDLKKRLTEEMKAAMKAGDKARLGVVRSMLAAIKQVEVDSQKQLSDEEIIAVLDKQVKQRRDSIQQYAEAGREDLAEQERYEMSVIQEFLPQPLSDEEIAALIDEAIEETGAAGMQDMGKVMGVLKPKMQGRADMGEVSKQVRARLAG
ncbi:GatB/YqeY domain-containing protein [Sulfurivirga sp.]|uniref:GatB/YqeY domain-containing protein n=1 Tax=Sulfurivirga sp. TaxID=2614236 RepID=UPI0025EC0628|nr:GatB/YqeY domain-containing protein [Sulfurivirga sp.]